MSTDLSLGLRGSGRDLGQRFGMTPEEVRLDFAEAMSSRWFVSLYGDTAGAAVGQGVMR